MLVFIKCFKYRRKACFASVRMPNKLLDGKHLIDRSMTMNFYSVSALLACFESLI